MELHYLFWIATSLVGPHKKRMENAEKLRIATAQRSTEVSQCSTHFPLIGVFRFQLEIIQTYAWVNLSLLWIDSNLFKATWMAETHVNTHHQNKNTILIICLLEINSWSNLKFASRQSIYPFLFLKLNMNSDSTPMNKKYWNWRGNNIFRFKLKL